MTKFIAYIAFLLTISTTSFGYDYNSIELNTSDNVTKAVTTVEVLGSTKGSGVLVVMDNKVVIVTNSHNLQGKTSALITLARHDFYYFASSPTFEMKNGNISFKGVAKVIYDFPLSDVAILELPEGIIPEQLALITKYALTNGVFSAEKGWSPSNRSLSFFEVVTAVLNGKPTVIEAIPGFKAGEAPDTFISGDGGSIWAIPIYGKPGVSGGGFYRRGVLTGLVTKISLAGEPIAIATPFTKIAKLLYSTPAIEKQVTWENGLVVYNNKGKTIALNPLRNGWMGNGGELLEIDDSKTGDSNPDYWRLQIMTAASSRVITTWDPFVYRPGEFNVNEENISFMKVKTKSFLKTTETYQNPSLASFIANESKGNEPTFLTNAPQNLAVLKEARLKQKTNINYARLYTHDYRDNYYKIYDLRHTTVNGAQPIKPMSKDRWAPRQIYNPLAGPRPLFEMDGAVTVDKDGYFYNIPFSTKISESNIFDIKLLGSFFGVGGSVFLTAPTDLTKVSLKFVNNQETQEIILKPVEFNSANSMVFKSPDGAYRVIYLYANVDLTQLARIYFASQDTLIELWAN